MFDQETWRFINSFAPWLAARGTLAAVIVSLYLARRASRLELGVFPAVVNLVQQGRPGPHQEFFQIRVVDHGRDAIVAGIG